MDIETYTLILSALLFAIGTAGVLLRRNAIIMFMFVMAVAAAEAAVGLAIIIAIFRHYELVDVDRFNLLKW